MLEFTNTSGIEELDEWKNLTEVVDKEFQDISDYFGCSHTIICNVIDKYYRDINIKVLGLGIQMEKSFRYIEMYQEESPLDFMNTIKAYLLDVTQALVLHSKNLRGENDDRE